MFAPLCWHMQMLGSVVRKASIQLHDGSACCGVALVCTKGHREPSALLMSWHIHFCRGNGAALKIQAECKSPACGPHELQRKN